MFVRTGLSQWLCQVRENAGSALAGVVLLDERQWRRPGGLSQFATAVETTQHLSATAVNRGPMNSFGRATMLSQTATAVAKLDAADHIHAPVNADKSTQVIDKKAYPQAGTLCVLLIADVSLASVSGSPLAAETIKTISHNNKNAPCEVRR
ncbi:hypothetical protein [Pseudomonas fluorescens]|uniref:hypothetical protein n=1 Tax=Pseudomonas fluorescens TaxID=294 RepID=UPI00163975B4|nr:hypothetical protein [Pseudomonas fluorescens]